MSTPLKWEEVKKGLDPKDYTIKTIFPRLKKMGDLYAPVLGKGINLQAALKNIFRACSLNLSYLKNYVLFFLCLIDFV